MSDKTNKAINKAIEVIAKIAEVFMWIGAAGSLLIAIFIGAAKEELLPLITDFRTTETQVSLFGSELEIGNVSDGRYLAAFVVFFIMAIIVCVLMAFVFRNINLIFKTTEGKTKFSKGATPFQPANVRMIREIGFFLIAVPIIQIIMNCIAAGVARGANISTDVNFFPVLLGLIVLALSQFFAYGVKLQDDVDGLL